MFKLSTDPWRVSSVVTCPNREWLMGCFFLFTQISALITCLSLPWIKYRPKIKTQKHHCCFTPVNVVVSVLSFTWTSLVGAGDWCRVALAGSSYLTLPTGCCCWGLPRLKHQHSFITINQVREPFCCFWCSRCSFCLPMILRTIDWCCYRAM